MNFHKNKSKVYQVRKVYKVKKKDSLGLYGLSNFMNLT